MSTYQKDHPTNPNDAPSLTTGLKAAEKTGAFPDLAEADLIALFNAATLIKLVPEEQAFSATELASQLIIVLSGELTLLVPDDNTGVPERFAPGDWICDGDFDAPPTDYRLTARVTGRGTALAVDRAAFYRLSDGLQTYLLRRMARINQARLRQQQEINQSLAQTQNQLLDSLYQWRVERGSGFAESPIVQHLFAKVPKLPISTLNLLNRILDDRTTKSEIVDMVGLDPSLTSTLLKAVNSPLYGLAGKVRDVHHAIVLLGHYEVYQIVISECTRYSLPETPAFAELHQRCVEISRIALTMARLQKGVKPAEVGTLGILSEIGRVITELLKSYNPQLTVLFEQVDPAEMGAELLRSWNLPQTLCDALRYQFYPEFAPPTRIPEEIRSSVALLYLARRMHQKLHGNEPEEPGLFVRDYMEQLEFGPIDEKTLFAERVLPRLRAQIAKLPRSLAELINARN